MAGAKKYRFNFGTLSYELDKVSPLRHLWRGIGIFILSFALFILFVWIMTDVFHVDMPKTMILRMKNDHWHSKVEQLNRRMDSYDEALSAMQERDDHVYRSLFGLNEIPSSVRESGLAGINRYVTLEEKNLTLAAARKRLDRLVKKAVVQSRSYDEVEALTARAGDIAGHIPAICPLSTVPGTFRYTSSFGYRTDPVYKGRGERHEGIDLACPTGTPVYAPGDGVVEMAEYYHGYGNLIVINHGFGYKTRYGHLSEMSVVKGQRITRGQNIGFVGCTGKSTGSHLHYEVRFRDTPVDPIAFFDMEMTPEDYHSVVSEVPDRIGKGRRK